MGLLSWLFPSPEDRVARARDYLQQGRPDEARLEVLEVDHPDAAAVLLEAETELARKNLEAAVSWGRAGDTYRVQTHLELANLYHRGGLEEQFRAARRELRQIREEETQAELRAKEAEAARLMSVDPLGITGGPSLLDPELDDGLLAEDREELEARLGLLVEGYPEVLRPQVRDLGAPFARAVLDLDDGRPDLALQALVQLPDDRALVQWERARAAHALGDPTAAARAVRSFAAHAEGHHPVGASHSAVFLAQLLAESGDVPGGLRVMRDARAVDPKLGGPLFAQLLEANGELAEADQVLTALIREHPRSPSLYRMLARVRVAGGHRMQAMRALEAALQATDCTPGRCGSQPPDLGVHRMLATLYLEDDLEQERALELAQTAAGLVQQPAWEDAYLAALAARARSAPETDALVQRLVTATPEDDPRHARARALLTG